MDKTSCCILCGGSKFLKLFDARSFASGSDKVFSLMRCETCGLVLTDPVPTVEEMADYYPVEYYDQLVDTVRLKTPMFLRQDKAAIVGAFKEKGIVLDFGCGAGFFSGEDAQTRLASIWF